MRGELNVEEEQSVEEEWGMGHKDTAEAGWP